jgi:superoxide reductase
MTEVNQVYRCSVCGNIVEVRHAAGGELVCCNQQMDLLVANTQDAATEKHVPVVTRTEVGIEVRVGEIDHPMDDNHYIEWITLITKNKTKTVYLAPGDEPRAIFKTTAEGGVVYEYCNLHGLWKIEI